MYSVNIKAVINCICDSQTIAICRATHCATLPLIWSIAWEGLTKAGGVRVVNTKLTLECQTLNRCRLSKLCREDLILFECYWIILKPLQWILTISTPTTISNRGCRAICTIWVPIRHHKSRCRDWGYERVSTLICLLNGLIVEHIVHSNLEPLTSLAFKILTS